jgi:hypothetical protein
MVSEFRAYRMGETPIPPRGMREDLGITRAEAGFLVAALACTPLCAATVADLEREVADAARSFVLDDSVGFDPSDLGRKVGLLSAPERESLLGAVALYYELDALPHEVALSASGLVQPPNLIP